MTLSPAQQAVVDSDSPRIVVASSAGSGKTTTLCKRIERLHGDGQDLSRVCAISFTQAAAAMLQERLGEYRIGFSGTIHSFVLSLLRKHGGMVGFPDPSHLTVLDNNAADQLLIDLILEEALTSITKKDIMAEIGKGLLQTNPMMNRRELSSVAYHRKLILSNSVTFDTILIHGLRLVKLLKTVPFDHALIDEGQDLSPIDHQIIDTLPITNKFWVGDFSQSIYGFRGASVKLFIDLCERPDTTLFKMEENRRSDILVCRYADALISHDPIPASLRKVNIPISTSPGVFTVTGFPTVTEELAHIARLALVDPGATALLVRTNDLVKFYTDALEARGVPVKRRKVVPWPADWRKTMLLLAIAANPHNDNLLMTYLRMTMSKGDLDEAWMKSAEHFVPLAKAAGFVVLGDQVLLNWLVGQHAISTDSADLLRRICGKIPASHTPGTILDAVAAIQDELTEDEGVGVTVCTIHSAKGREWPVVICAAWENGHLPDNARSDESRRVAFVALTRARHEVHVTWSATRQNPHSWGIDQRERSSFLDEMNL